MASKRDAASTSYWPLWGVAAGVLGYVGHLLTVANVTDEQRQTGINVVSLLHRNNLFTVVLVGMLLLTGLPGFPGIVAPGWMIIMGVGLVASLRHGTATARQPELTAIGD